jgi:uncharacterized OB-fold protein
VEQVRVARKPIREGLLDVRDDDLRAARLVGSRCAACGETTLGSNPVCPNCGGDRVVSSPLSREGTLWTYTVIRHRPPGNYLGPEPFQPFGLGLVELPDGLRVLSPLEGDPGKFSIGMPMELSTRILRTDTDGAEIVAFAFKSRD